MLQIIGATISIIIIIGFVAMFVGAIFSLIDDD